MNRIVILDRDRATCEAIARGLGEMDGVVVEGTATSAGEVRRILSSVAGRGVTAVVASYHLPTAEVLDLAGSLREEEDAPALMVTGLPDSEGVVLELLEAGVTAYLTDDLSISGLHFALRLLEGNAVLLSPTMAYRLLHRLHELAELVEGSGVNPSLLDRLTRKEREVLDLLAHGLSNRDIARRLFISVGTVKSHVHKVLRKLRVGTRDDAARVLKVVKVLEANPGGGGESPSPGSR